MNIGTIVEFAKLKVRRMASPKSKRGRIIGEIEERFIVNLNPGDTFAFGGEVLAYQGVRDMAIEAYPARARPKVPAYAGGTMPLSTYLSDGVRRVLNDRASWQHLPGQIQDWLILQSEFSALPRDRGVLVEAFFEDVDHVLVVHTFEGRKVNNALGFLMTKRMEKFGLKPISFTITDYALTIKSIDPVNDITPLLSSDMLGDDLDNWIVHSPMVKRSFRKIATIAGLTEQRLPGQQRTMKQVTFSTDLIYDVLMKYDPDHILLRIAREEAENDLLDVERLRHWLKNIQRRIDFKILPHASPLSIPAMAQIGKEPVRGSADAAMIAELDRQNRGTQMLERVKAFVDDRD